VTCPHCAAEVSSGLQLNDEVECPECEKKFKAE